MFKKGFLLLYCAVVFQNSALAAPTRDESDWIEPEYTSSVNVLSESDSDSTQVDGGDGDVTLSYRESLLHRLREEHELGYYTDFPESLAITMSIEELESIFLDEDDDLIDSDEESDDENVEQQEGADGSDESADADFITEKDGSDNDEDEEVSEDEEDDNWLGVLYEHKTETAGLLLGGAAVGAVGWRSRREDWEDDEDDYSDDNDSDDNEENLEEHNDDYDDEDDIAVETVSYSDFSVQDNIMPSENHSNASDSNSYTMTVTAVETSPHNENGDNPISKTDPEKTGVSTTTESTVVKPDSSKPSNKSEASSNNINSIGDGHVNPASVYQVLRNLGFNKVAACGIMGNIMQESSFNTYADNDGNYIGLCQWDTDGRWPALVSYAQANGINPYDAGTQLRFMHLEAEASWRAEWCAVNEVNQCSTPEEAAAYWQRYYEGASGQEDYERGSYAREYYETFV